MQIFKFLMHYSELKMHINVLNMNYFSAITSEPRYEGY